MKLGFHWPSGFREVVEIVDGWTTEPAYTISFPGAFGSGALKKFTFGILCKRKFHLS